MFAIAALIVTHLAAVGAGVFAGPHITTWVSGLSASRAVANAKALVAKAEADAKALEAAKKVVASQPTPVTVTVTGATGA